jgi:hypothetical protein
VFRELLYDYLSFWYELKVNTPIIWLHQPAYSHLYLSLLPCDPKWCLFLVDIWYKELWLMEGREKPCIDI